MWVTVCACACNGIHSIKCWAAIKSHAQLRTRLLRPIRRQNEMDNEINTSPEWNGLHDHICDFQHMHTAKRAALSIASACVWVLTYDFEWAAHADRDHNWISFLPKCFTTCWIVPVILAFNTSGVLSSYSSHTPSIDDTVSRLTLDFERKLGFFVLKIQENFLNLNFTYIWFKLQIFIWINSIQCLRAKKNLSKREKLPKFFKKSFSPQSQANFEQNNSLLQLNISEPK